MDQINNQIRYRMKPIQKIKIREERFATPDNAQLMAKARFKQAVIKILTKIQAYHIYEKIKRNKHCIIPVHNIVKNYHHMTAATKVPDGKSGGKDVVSGERNMGVNQSFANRTPFGQDQQSGDSEDVFEDEDQSSSDCESDEEEPSAYSQADNAGDMFSQEGSIKNGDQKINQLGNKNESAYNSPIKLPVDRPDGEASASKTKNGQSGFDSSEDSEFFDQEEQQKLNWQ